MRLISFFTITAWSYASRNGGLFATRGEALRDGIAGPGAEGIANGLVFTWGFLQLIMWFWVSFYLRQSKALRY